MEEPGGGKSNPCTRLGRALGVPGGWDSQILWQHMKVVRLSALHTGHLFSSENIPGTHSVKRPSQPWGHSSAGRIISMKNSSDTIGNRTHSFPACSTVPQPSVPLCTWWWYWGKILSSQEVLILFSGNIPCGIGFMLLFYDRSRTSF